MDDQVRPKSSPRYLPVMSSALEFRQATIDDLTTVVTLLADDAVARTRSGWVAEVTPAIRTAFEEIAADPNNELWVAERDGEVVGTLQLTFIPGLSRNGMKRALVEAVRVRSDLRGQRIGERFMNAVIERARQRGCGLIQLTTDRRRTDAHRFYERLGFEPSHVGMKRLL